MKAKISGTDISERSPEKKEGFKDLTSSFYGIISFRLQKKGKKGTEGAWWVWHASACEAIKYNSESPVWVTDLSTVAPKAQHKHRNTLRTHKKKTKVF